MKMMKNNPVTVFTVSNINKVKPSDVLEMRYFHGFTKTGNPIINKVLFKIQTISPSINGSYVLTTNNGELLIASTGSNYYIRGEHLVLEGSRIFLFMKQN